MTKPPPTKGSGDACDDAETGSTGGRRIYLIIEDDAVFHPIVVRDLVQRLAGRHDLVGATIPTGDGRKLSPQQRANEALNVLGLRAALALRLQRRVYALLETFSLRQCGCSFSLLRTLQELRIPVHVCQNVNAPEHLQLLRSFDIDVVVCCCHQIFGKSLLALPRVACVNRHTGRLPGYAGLYPVFWALLNGEPTIGHSVHTMETVIDGGRLLAQENLPATPALTMYGAYSWAFSRAGALIGEAIETLLTTGGVEMNAAERKYFGPPTADDGAAFRRHRRYYRWSELLRRVALPVRG